MSRILSLGATVLVAGTIFAACNKPKQQTTSDLQREANEIAAAIQAGKPIKCTITRVETEEHAAAQMEYLMKGEKIKMTGVEIQGNEQDQGAMISDGEFVYVWDNQTKEGFKFPVTDPEEAQEAASNKPDGPDFSQEDVQRQYEDQGYTLDCDQTNISDEEFTPPADVTFQDFSAMMEGMMQEAQDSMKNATNGLTDEQKAAMEEVLKQSQQ